jgi:hypothetical protein
MTPSASIPTPAGVIAALPVHGLSSAAVVHVHSLGAVGVSDLEGRSVWSRSEVSFVREVAGSLTSSPRLDMGRNGLQPSGPLDDHPFAVADLTGDGVDDVAVAHRVTGSPTKTTVDVLDGTNGATTWMGVYSGSVNELSIVGDVLVAAERPDGSGGAATLHGIRFGTPTPTEPWSYSPGAAAKNWYALEGNAGLVSAAWSGSDPYAATAGERGRVVLLDAATGAVKWSVGTLAYPRIVRFDTGRQQVAVLAQTSPVDPEGSTYTVSAYALATGLPGAVVTRASAVPFAFEVGDLSDDGASEWAVSDVQLAPTSGVTRIGNRVAAIAPTTGAILWQKNYLEAGSKHPSAQDLVISATGGTPVLIAAAFAPEPADTQLTAYRGTTGAELWTKRATNLGSPYYLAATTIGGRAAVLSGAGHDSYYGATKGRSGDLFGREEPVQPVVPYNSITTWAIDDGSVLARAALLGDIRSAVPLDVNGDPARDLVIGTDSGAVLALDGTRLTEDPGVLWRRVFATQVHEVRTADVDGDGASEVVVTAAHTVAVLDGRTGAVRWSVALPSTFQWSTTVADVDGDGDGDLLVPATDLRAYDGRNGALLWRYAPSGSRAFGSAAFADGVVAAQYLGTSGASLPVLPTEGVASTKPSPTENDVLLDGRTGALRWTHAQAQGSAPTLWQSAVLGHSTAGVSGIAAAFTWQTGGEDTSTAHIDVYDAATGNRTATAARGNPDGIPQIASTGTLTIGGFVEVLADGGALGIGPSGSAVDNLQGWFPTAGAPVVVGGQEFLALAGRRLSAGQLELVAPGQLGAGTPVLAGSLGVPASPGGVTAADVDGDGDDELIALPFNWDGFGGSQVLTGRWGSESSSGPRALTIVDLQPTA